MKYIVFSIFAFLVACGPGFEAISTNVEESNPVVIRAQAYFTVNSNTLSEKASSPNIPINYINAAAVTFTVSTVNLISGGFTGDTLNFGNVQITDLSDNSLKVCGPSGTTKCGNAYIRIYTIGSVSGFVHSIDNYGVPLFVGSLNPTTPVGLTTAGAVNVQQYTIPPTKNKLTLVNFPNPVYNVTMDFSNAGDGQYSAIMVVEYVLSL